MNEILFFLHVVIITACSLCFLKMGKQALVSFICMQGILSNLLVTKQMTVFGFDVTCSDVFAVGVIISLNLLQEYYGQDAARRAIWISFAMLLAYLMMTQIHLWYIPSSFDTMNCHFQALFSLMPRLTISSISVYLIVQHFDSVIFALLKKIFNNRFFTLRSIISLTLSQLIDTTLFTLFALYGIVASVSHVIFFSFFVKLMVIALATPCIALTKKCIPLQPKR